MKRAALAAGAAVVLIAAVWIARGAKHASESQAPGTAPAATTPSPAVQPSGSPTTPATVTSARSRPQMPARAATPGLEQDLRDPDPHVRSSAVRELAASDHPDPEVLAAASRDSDLGVAIAGTEGLAKLYRDGQVPATELVARVTTPGTPDRVRVTAINGLGIVPSPETASLLVDQLAHGDAIGKRSAAILLQHQDPSIAVPALIGALGDADTGTRDNAHESLVTIARGRDFKLDAAAWSAWWQSRR